MKPMKVRVADIDLFDRKDNITMSDVLQASRAKARIIELEDAMQDMIDAVNFYDFEIERANIAVQMSSRFKKLLEKK